MLIRIIEQYLENHKRLVIPQLGAFLVKEEPRVIVFSELMRRDDGVLQALLVEQGVSEVEARGEIDRLVYEVRHAIEQGECFYLSDFGEFKPGKNATIAFDYHPRLCVVPESPIEIMPDLIEKVRPEARQVEENRVDVVEPNSIQPQQPVWSAEDLDDEEDEFVEQVSEEELLADEVEPMQSQTKTPHRGKAPHRRAPQKGAQKPDRFLLVAIVAAVIALMAIAFGLYNDAMNAGEGEEPIEMIDPWNEMEAKDDPAGN